MLKKIGRHKNSRFLFFSLSNNYITGSFKDNYFVNFKDVYGYETGDVQNRDTFFETPCKGNKELGSLRHMLRF